MVSFFTRDQGKLRGVARRARRPKSPFGAGLERLSQVRVAYYQRETRELVNLDSCELIRSQFDLVSDYTAGVALDYIAEICERYGGGGHPVVGAVSVAADDVTGARRILSEIAATLAA